MSERGERRAALSTFVRRARRVGLDSARWRVHAEPVVASLADSAAASANRPLVDHVAFYTRGNAGDTVLVSAVRAAFDVVAGAHRWQSQHAHWRFGDRALARASGADLVVVGGGGLFIADTNRNARSGWQWNVDVDTLRSIEAPIVVFAVGYNRFRGQEEFPAVFVEHVTALAEQSLYVGLRNTGSIEALRSYLPDALHHRLRFQPCPTTVLGELAPQLLTPPPTTPVIGVNLAFDRAGLRFGDRLDQILGGVLAALRELETDGAQIRFLAQCPEDERLVPALEGLRTLDVVPLYGLGPRRVVQELADTSVVLGMRGHAQMIPFGIRRPIVSLITHDKLRFFLDDIGRPQWGVEAAAEDLVAQLVQRLRTAIDDGPAIAADIAALQAPLWAATTTNVTDAVAAGAVAEAA